MKLMSAAIVALLGLWASAPAGAQRSIHVAVAGGAAFPTGKTDSLYSAGPSGLVALAFGSQDTPIGLRLDYQYAGFKGRTVSGTTLGDAHLSAITANLVIAFRVDYVKPYLIGGGGLYPLRLPGAEKSKNDWGANGGAGIAFPLPYTSIGAFVEARYHAVNTSSPARYHFIPVTLGLLF
jgi:outer membrane protein with beta-barrel domain